MRRKAHVRFLGGWARVTASGYPTRDRLSDPRSYPGLDEPCIRRETLCNKQIYFLKRRGIRPRIGGFFC